MPKIGGKRVSIKCQCSWINHFSWKKKARTHVEEGPEGDEIIGSIPKCKKLIDASNNISFFLSLDI